MNMKIHSFIIEPKDDSIVARLHRQSLNGFDYKTLNPQKWLSDEVSTNSF